MTIMTRASGPPRVDLFELGSLLALRTCLKRTSDRKLITTDAQGHTVNTLTAFGVVEGGTDINEINYLLVKSFRCGHEHHPDGSQARIRHRPAWAKLSKPRGFGTAKGAFFGVLFCWT